MGRCLCVGRPGLCSSMHFPCFHQAIVGYLDVSEKIFPTDFEVVGTPPRSVAQKKRESKSK